MRPEKARRRWRSTHAKACLAAIVIAVLAAACTSLLAIKDPTLDDAGGGGPSEAGAIDAAVDSSIDAGPDSSIDAGIDSSIDAPIDGPPAECTTGVCCNTSTLKFEPTTKVCNTSTVFQCSPAASSCGGQPQQAMNQQFCSGDAATCTGRTVPGTFTNLGAACGAGQLCVPQSGGAAPQCSTCQFGCDPGATVCRAPKIFAFITDAASNGAFGAVAAGPRRAADIRCENMYNANFTTRGCTNIHAVLQVDDVSDTIERTKVTFPTLPASAQVFRATADGTQVSTNFDTFVDPNSSLLAPLKVSATPIPFWSGRGTNVNCSSWASNSSTAAGVAGDASKTGGWMSLLGPTCNSIDQHLLCVCW